MAIEETLAKIEAVLLDIRTRVERMESRQPEPTCLTYPAAAVRLGVGLTKLKRMVKAGEIGTVRIGKVPMVTLAEIQRITTPPPERPALAARERKTKWVPLPIGKRH